jgi:hypothetical protein
MKNGESQGFYKTDGGIDTKDWVFLLSYREATTGYLSDMTRRACEATPCVLAKAGAGNALWYRNIWLLRSPGDYEDRVVCMAETGQRIPEDVTFRGGVRPAIWLRFSGE